MSGSGRRIHVPTVNNILHYNDHPSIPNNGSPTVVMECLTCGGVLRRKQPKVGIRNYCSPKCAAKGRSQKK